VVKIHFLVVVPKFLMKTIRAEICEDKCSTAQWLEIHETAHNLGMPSNATMLYGHIETYAHRIDHMERLRTLQDKTGGFNTFIPLNSEIKTIKCQIFRK
jgi:2-iminoacetate synthase ThiH